MPFTKSKRYRSNAHLTTKGNYNPFPDIYQTPIYDNKIGVESTSSSNSKPFKKGRKCFQIALLCQKLLKPFGGGNNNGSNKTGTDKNGRFGSRRLEKSRSAHQINTMKSTPNLNHTPLLQNEKRNPPIEAPITPNINTKIDVSCQTNFENSFYDNIHRKNNYDIDNNNNNDDNNIIITNQFFNNRQDFHSVKLGRQQKSSTAHGKKNISCDLLDYSNDDDDDDDEDEFKWNKYCYNTNIINDNNHNNVDINNNIHNNPVEQDIDSAIVGDFNSLSNDDDSSSLNEQIDPLYSTIKWYDDPVDSNNNKSKFLQSQTMPYCYFDSPETLCFNQSNTSSPKSGVYTKINKPPKNPLKFINYPKDFNNNNNSNNKNNITKSKLHIVGDKSHKLNFDHIMRIRSQLGLVVSSNQNLNSNLFTTPNKVNSMRSQQYILGLDNSFNGSNNNCTLNNNNLNNPYNNNNNYNDNMNNSINNNINNSQICLPPKIPNRNYGNSVIDLITQARDETLATNVSMLFSRTSTCSSSTNIPLTNSLSMDDEKDGSISHNELYSPIWLFNPRYKPQASNVPTTATTPTTKVRTIDILATPPSTEPIQPKKYKELRTQINPLFKDTDSINSSSCISIYSPVKKLPLNYYPPFEKMKHEKHDSDDDMDEDDDDRDEKKCDEELSKKGLVNLINGDLRSIRHMDSDVELSKYSVRPGGNNTKLYDLVKDINDELLTKTPSSISSNSPKVPYKHGLLMSSSFKKLIINSKPCLKQYQLQVKLDDEDDEYDDGNDKDYTDSDDNDDKKPMLTHDIDEELRRKLQPLMERSCEYDDFGWKQSDGVDNGGGNYGKQLSLDFVNF